MIKTVFFDLDETLLDDERTARVAEARASQWAARRRVGVDAEALRDAYHTANHAFWHGYDQRLEPRSGEEIRRSLWLEGLLALSIADEDFAEEISQTYHSIRNETYALFPDALPCLAELRPHFSLGLVTNGAASLQRAKVSALGLEKQVDFIVVAGDVGISKPDAGIFEHALSLAGCAPENAAMVGDLLDRDILGALNAGLLPIWINRHVGHPDLESVPATMRVNRDAKTSPPRHTVTSLRDIFPLLRSL